MKTENSTQYFARSLKVAPGGVHSPVRAFKSVGGLPLFFQRADGAFLETVDGELMLDFCQSFGPHLLGHRDPDVAKIVHETVDIAWSFGACEPYSLALAEWMCARLPWVDKIRFVSSGTEAVMSALRVARAATGRSQVLKFEGCYHGHADSLLVKAGSGLAGESAADSAGVDASVAHNTLVAPLNDEAAVAKIFKTHGSTIAALIIEPLPANFGLLEQRPEFLKSVTEMARAHGALVIFDEVISGFRVGLGGMAERTGLTPDLVTYGKVIGGGFPVGAYGGRADLMDLIAPSGPVYQAGTLSANPIGMRAGLATLEKAERLNVFADLESRTKNWVAGLKEMCDIKRWPITLTSVGSIFWWHLRTDEPIRSVRDLPATQGAEFRRLFHACLDQGLYLAPSGFEVGFISHAHTRDVLDQASEKLVRALETVYG